MYSITFKFEQKGLEPITLNNVAADQSILEVALDNGIELHHNCGGVCACSTCHLYLEKGEDFIDEITDKEEDFIDRAVNPRLNSRLGCQCVLHPGRSGEIAVTLPDQTQFLGE
jgi:ferredoxin, 2Fe-2S